MAEPLRPASALTRGRKNWLWVPTIAVTTAPTVAELTAVSAIDITRILFASTGQPDSTTNRVTSEARWGDTDSFERLGTTSYTGGDVMSQFNPQGIAASEGVKLWEAFIAGAVGNFVRRLNVPRATNLIAGQFVTVFPVEVGPGFEMESGEGEAAEAAFKSAFAVTDTPAFKKAITA